MTSEPMHTASKERMVPELLMFSFGCTPQLFESAVAITLHFQLCSAHYTALHTKNNRNASAINPVTMKI